MDSHLAYVKSFMIKSKEFQGEIQWRRLSGADSSEVEQQLGKVGKCHNVKFDILFLPMMCQKYKSHN